MIIPQYGILEPLLQRANILENIDPRKDCRCICSKCIDLKMVNLLKQRTNLYVIHRQWHQAVGP